MIKKVLMPAIVGFIILGVTAMSFAKCCGTACCDNGKCGEEKACCECCKK